MPVVPFVNQLAVIQINIDPALHIGPFSVHWYGVMYAVAFWAGWKFAVTPFLTARGFTRGEIDRMITWVIVFGLIGGRLYYVLQSDLLYYLTHPQHILAVWEGGMAFFGAIISGLGTCYVLAGRRGYPFWPLFDAAVLFAVVGQPIGRIGNVINGDILGSLSTLPWATAYVNPHAILQSKFQLCDPNGFCPAYQPAAVYEALGTIAIGVVLWMLLRADWGAGDHLCRPVCGVAARVVLPARLGAGDLSRAQAGAVDGDRDAGDRCAGDDLRVAAHAGFGAHRTAGAGGGGSGG